MAVLRDLYLPIRHSDGSHLDRRLRDDTARSGTGNAGQERILLGTVARQRQVWLWPQRLQHLQPGYQCTRPVGLHQDPVFQFKRFLDAAEHLYGKRSGAVPDRQRPPYARIRRTQSLYLECRFQRPSHLPPGKGRLVLRIRGRLPQRVEPRHLRQSVGISAGATDRRQSTDRDRWPHPLLTNQPKGAGMAPFLKSKAAPTGAAFYFVQNPRTAYALRLCRPTSVREFKPRPSDASVRSSPRRRSFRCWPRKRSVRSEEHTSELQ